MSKLISKKELAEVLNICIVNITALTDNGEIPCYKLGKRTYRYDLEEVLKAVNSRKEKGE